MEREISPPPTKRRKLAATQTDRPHQAVGSDSEAAMGTRTRCIRIFSWNINGVQAFLPPSTLPITSFFKPTSQHNKRTRDTSPPVDHVSPSPRNTTPFNSPLRAFLARHHWPEVLFLQELKISPADHATPAALLSATNTPSGPGDPALPATTYTLDVNRPRDRHNARGFGGRLYGVGTLLRADFAARHVAAVRRAAWDLEGRVTIVELRPPPLGGDDGDAGRGESSSQHGTARPLALVNVYAVNGTAAPYRAPETGAPAGTRHEHKLAFHARLRDDCLELEGRGFEVVVAGDLNVARGPLDGHPSLRTWPAQHSVNRADFNSKFFGDEDNEQADAYVGGRGDGTGDGGNGERERGFDGVDVFRALHGGARRYTYHPRRDGEWDSSCDRVDMIIVSKSLHQGGRVVDTDILDTPQERGTSDHVPLWVTVALSGQEDTGLVRDPKI